MKELVLQFYKETLMNLFNKKMGVSEVPNIGKAAGIDYPEYSEEIIKLFKNSNVYKDYLYRSEKNKWISHEEKFACYFIALGKEKIKVFIEALHEDFQIYYDFNLNEIEG